MNNQQKNKQIAYDTLIKDGLHGKAVEVMRRKPFAGCDMKDKKLTTDREGAKITLNES